MTTKEAVALLERYSNYDGMGIPNLAGCKEAMRVAVDALKEACPELRESEDERIRKQLIDAIKIGRSNSGISFTEEAASRYIAWLGKHSEEEIQKIRKEEYTNGFNDAVGFGKQKEQEPISQEDFDTAKHEALWGEQKPEWKPQPESLEALMYAIDGKWDMISPTSYLSRRLEDLYEGLVNTFNVDESLIAELPKVASRAYTAEDIEELRELKRKIETSMEQKPGKWSEEEQRMLNVAIRSCEQTIEDYPNDTVRFRDCIIWLKSLRPCWKPSEEQMEALKDAVRLFKETHFEKFHYKIESLYNQLKKL